MAAWASLAALLVAIALSMTTRINVGVVSIALAWVVGQYVAGQTAAGIVAGFPASLFLTLTGITLLFSAAETNGTLEKLTGRAAALARGDARMLPLVFFAIACGISAVGPGAISSVALVAPIAMAMAARAGVSPFLTALVVTNGANAGNLSPVSSVGVIANTAMTGAGLPDHEGVVWFGNFAASALVAAAAYVVLGGWKAGPIAIEHSVAAGAADTRGLALSWMQRLTLVVLVAWIAGVVLGLHLGLSAFAAAAVLIAIGAADERAALRRVPWGVIVMVSGVTVLIALLDKTGGMALFSSMLSRLASPATVNAAMAFVTGAISLYSSTSGVVMPAFLPTVPSVIAQVGGGDPLALALSINIGSSLVDVSPLSTLGALCVAAVADGPEATSLFRKLMAWGLAMVIVGAVVAAALAPMLAGI
ncbi:MAG TPA: SLC13 family permease [Vicinamibacterales bacterium]|nr:SLC13 family permease [Vicinamibacterales bacterium]